MVGFNATTEVFLAPATERTSVSMTTSPDSQKSADRMDDGSLGRIKNRLLQTLSASSSESIKTLQPNLITVRPDDQGSGTVIMLQNLSNPFKAADQAAQRDWIKKTLGLSDEEARKMEVSPSSGDSKDLTIRIINLKPEDLAKRLGPSSIAPSAMTSPAGAEAKAKQVITDLLTNALSSEPTDATKDIDPAQITVHATSSGGTKLTLKNKSAPFQQADEARHKTWLASALKLSPSEANSLGIKYDQANSTTLDVTIGVVSLDMWPSRPPR
jgi:hypothetical protein